MKSLALIFLFALSTNSFAGEALYKKTTGIWTGNNARSSAPNPYCPCDINPNVKDCPSEFIADTAGDICYDEYIPKGSKGWVHAVIYKRQ